MGFAGRMVSDELMLCTVTIGMHLGCRDNDALDDRRAQRRLDPRPVVLRLRRFVPTYRRGSAAARRSSSTA
jgi:hypothetical protein